MMTTREMAIVAGAALALWLLAASGGLYDSKIITVTGIDGGQHQRIFRTNKLTGEICERDNVGPPDWECH